MKDATGHVVQLLLHSWDETFKSHSGRRICRYQASGELRRALGEESRKEIDRSVEKVRGAVEPYTRFVRGESASVEERAALLTQARERLAALKRKIKDTVPAW
jgi:hypothetical protein